MDEVAGIDQAIVALEAQRAVLGDAVVDTALQPLREKRAAIVSRLEGEQRKLVTVLFSDLVDFTVLSQALDAEDVRSVVNRYFSCWQHHIEANGGVVEKFIGDAVMAVFGIRQAREEDPHLAIRAALAMREALQELNREIEPVYGVSLAMRVGIDTGDVVVGTLDERPNQEVAVVGETVNRAARLQAAAPVGGVLISGDTYRHVRGSFSLRPVPGLQLKGIAHPVDAFEVLKERPRGFRLDAARGVEGVQTRTIGRDLELRQLQDRFCEVVEDSRWRVITIVGDAGVGKSRLLGELDRWLAEIPESVWWFRARAAPSGENRPNALIREVIASRLEIQESDGPAVVREKWTAGFERVFGPGPDGARKAAVIARWLGFDLGDDADDAGDPAGGHDTQQLRDQAVEYTAECFRILAAENPVVVLLEDLHWADDASLDWMDEADALLSDSPVFIVATARPTLFERRALWGEGRDHHLRFDLASLSRRDSRLLVSEILQRVDHVPSSLTDLVVTAAEGNAFYIEELVTWLIDAGVIVRDGDRWHVLEDRVGTARVPLTLKGVLQARLDALSAPEHLALQRAAVIGRVFWDDAVDDLGSAPSVATGREVDAAEALDRLRSRTVVFEREQSAFDGTREFLFKHALLRDATYESVLRAHRQVYHGLAARWLERTTERSRRTDQYASLIADHHAGAGDGATAAQWYLRAGRQASAVHALTEAARLLARGLETAPEDARRLRFDLLLAREGVLERLADRLAQMEALAALDAAQEELEDPECTVRVLVARSRRSFNDSEYAAQNRTAQRAVELAHDAGLVEMEVEARLWWGKGLTWDYQHDAARAVLEQTLEGARQTAQRWLEGETLRYLAIVANNRSEFPEAVALLEQARDVHRADGDAESEGVVVVQLSSVLYNQGHYASARVLLEEAMPTFMASGYKYRQAVVMSNLGVMLLALGELGAARRHLLEGLELSRVVGDRESMAVAYAALADLYRRAGDLDLAETDFRRAIATAGEIGSSAVSSEAILGLALVRLERGDAEDARRTAADALDDARRASSRLAEARALVAQGRIELRAGRLDRAEPLVREGLHLAEELELSVVVVEAKAALAHCLVASGHTDEARGLVDDVLPLLVPTELAGALDPGDVYHACWSVLAELHDERASDVLRAARAFLDQTAAVIDDDDLRSGFLTRVPTHVELARAVRS
jgi:class 3 adenylate cyclase/tetratricopeptide (TPR) repeat protein